jgi:hypothetical protein
MIAKDPSLRDFIDRATGYAIYPNVGKAGVGIGGAYGRGVLYEHGRPTGYTELKQGSVGVQLGAQSYAELIVFENEAAINRIKSGDFDVGAEASAVALKANAAKAATFQGGAAVFQMSRGGLMAAAAINGQKLNYQPMDQSTIDRSGTAGDRSSTTRSSTDIQLRTDSTTSDRVNETSGSAQTASEQTQQRIEQRGQDAADHARDASQNPQAK